MLNYINDTIQQIEEYTRTIVTNSISKNIIKIALIFLCIFPNFLLTPELIVLYDNVIFKILILMLIFYLSYFDVTISVLITIAFIISINNINNIKLYDLLNISPMNNNNNLSVLNNTINDNNPKPNPKKIDEDDILQAKKTAETINSLSEDIDMDLEELSENSESEIIMNN